MYNMEEHAKRHFELAGTVTVGPKGQVVIPSDVRARMGIAPGDKLIALYMPAKGSVGFVTEEKMQHIVEMMGKNVEELRSVLDK